MQTASTYASSDRASVAGIDELCWYAIQTYPQNEKKVAAELEKRSVEIFLPLRTEIHQWSDRKKLVEVPLFPCYAFVRLPATPDTRVKVLQTPRVLRLLGTSNIHPTPVPDDEIESIRTLVASNVALSPFGFLRVGEKVRIRGGALDGVEGILVGHDDDRKLVASVDLIQQAVALSLRGYDIERA